jgi:hypothetical protein
LKRKADGKEARTPLVGDGVAGEVLNVGQGMHDGSIPASGAKHHLPYAMRLQEGGQLQYAFFV